MQKCFLIILKNYAKKKKIDFLYLQGIENFYTKLGFQGFSYKSKFIRKDFNRPKGKIIDFKDLNKNDIKKFTKITVIEEKSLLRETNSFGMICSKVYLILICFSNQI